MTGCVVEVGKLGRSTRPEMHGLDKRDIENVDCCCASGKRVALNDETDTSKKIKEILTLHKDTDILKLCN